MFKIIFKKNKNKKKTSSSRFVIVLKQGQTMASHTAVFSKGVISCYCVVCINNNNNSSKMITIIIVIIILTMVHVVTSKLFSI